jgi:high-affinity Fe2+/Pb2+ permease
MAKKSSLKSFLLVLIFIALVIVAFVLLGGGSLLKTAGKKSDEIKGTIEKGADSIEKKVEKVKEVMSSGEKK